MTGREAGHRDLAPDPNTLEVAPGAQRQQLQGWVPELARAEDLLAALEQAFDYRGDVLITLKDGSSLEGYIFDRRTGSRLEDSLVRLLPKNSTQKVSVRYSDIVALAFSGRDMAAGKSWEAWVRKYWQKRNAGEKDIALRPEPLD